MVVIWRCGYLLCGGVRCSSRGLRGCGLVGLIAAVEGAGECGREKRGYEGGLDLAGMANLHGDAKLPCGSVFVSCSLKG